MSALNPEGDWSQVDAEHERMLRTLNIRDWADGILSDPTLCKGDPNDLPNRQMGQWERQEIQADGQVHRWEYRLWRIDAYLADKGPCSTSQYNLSAENRQDEQQSRFYMLPVDASTPLSCDTSWAKLAKQNGPKTRQEMLNHLRTSPVDTRKMRTRRDIETIFNTIARAHRRFGRKVLRDAIIDQSNAEFLGEIFDRDND